MTSLRYGISKRAAHLERLAVMKSWHGDNDGDGWAARALSSIATNTWPGHVPRKRQDEQVPHEDGVRAIIYSSVCISVFISHLKPLMY